MSRRRGARLNEQIRREVADILLQQVNDPRVGALTVTGVRVTPDLQQARVFVAVSGAAEARSETLAGLTAATSFIRTELARRLLVRRVPELRFEIDESLDYGMHIDRLLHEVRSAEDARPAADEAAGDDDTSAAGTGDGAGTNAED